MKPKSQLILISIILILFSLILACDFATGSDNDAQIDDSQPEDFDDAGDELDDETDGETKPDDEPDDEPIVELDPLKFMSHELSNITFSQLDFMTMDEETRVDNSCWGRMDYSYDPPTEPHFLNVAAFPDDGASPQWVIHNLPLTTYPGNPPETDHSAFFNLCDLGIEEGQSMDQGTFQIQVTEDLLLGDPPPDVPPMEFPIQPRLNISEYQVNYGDPDSTVSLWPGEPMNVFLMTLPTYHMLPRDIQPVQEGHFQCMAGAFARSIQYLNSVNNPQLTHTAQDIFGDLTGMGVSIFPTTPTTFRDMQTNWVTQKTKYTQGDGISTSVWDKDNIVNPINGVSESTGDFKEWLLGNAENDVEISYRVWDPRQGKWLGHIVTISQMYSVGDTIYVDYRDDEHQRDDDAGDAGVKDGIPIYKHDDGFYRFGSDHRIIGFAAAEAYTATTKGNWQAFATLLVGDWEHGIGQSEVEGGAVIRKADPIPAADATVTFKMTLPDGSTQLQTAVTDETGYAETSFTIYFYGNYEVSIENIEGDGIEYAPEKNLADSIMVNVVGGDTDDFYTANAVQLFYDRLNEAFVNGDVETLLAMLHNETRTLYGYDQCTAYLLEAVNPPVWIDVLSIEAFGDWDYERDGWVIPITNAYTVNVNVTADGQTNPAVTHLALNPDGTLGWFTDCGDPLTSP